MIRVFLFQDIHEIFLLDILPQFELGIFLQEYLLGHPDIYIVQCLHDGLVVHLLPSLFEKVVIIEHGLEIGFGEELLCFLQLFQSIQQIGSDVVWPARYEPNDHLIKKRIYFVLGEVLLHLLDLLVLVLFEFAARG